MGKIGLVLCGGVAKGAYEAGVLKALAEHRIHPDVIVGISAGAINGTFTAQLLASGQFTAQAIEDDLIRHWRDTVTSHNLYDGLGLPEDILGRKALRTLFDRLGIDPLRRQYRPRLGFDTLFAFEQLVRGDFASLISHGFLRSMLDNYLERPSYVHKDVILSVASTNLLGETCLDDLKLSTNYSIYDDFYWNSQLDETKWEAMAERLTQRVTASSSFPFVFPPVIDDTEDGCPQMLVDGGLWDSAPIGRAISLDPEVDTVIVVSGSTVVDAPDELPTNMYRILGRVFSMLAGRFIIRNFQKVLKMNQKLAAVDALIKRGKNGQILNNQYNRTVVIAAGFGSIEEFASKRIVQLVPVFPSPSLPGDVFDGFFSKDLRASYIDQGYADAIRALSRQSLVEPAEERTVSMLVPSFEESDLTA